MKRAKHVCYMLGASESFRATPALKSYIFDATEAAGEMLGIGCAYGRRGEANFWEQPSLVRGTSNKINRCRPKREDIACEPDHSCEE